MRAFSRGELAALRVYSRSHCFVRIPTDAETRLRTRLENHSMLMRTERESTEKPVLCVGDCCAAVPVFAASCAEIWPKRFAVLSSGSSCSSLYDSMLNAVTTAEKRPACGRGVSGIRTSRALSNTSTHKDQETVHIFLPTLYQMLVVFPQSLDTISPSSVGSGARYGWANPDSRCSMVAVIHIMSCLKSDFNDQDTMLYVDTYRLHRNIWRMCMRHNIWVH